MFLKTWNLRSNSVTKQVTFNRTKIAGKCQNSKNQKRHFESFSNTVHQFVSLSLFDILQTLLNFEKDSNGIWSGAKTCQLFCLAKNWIVDIEVTFHVARKQNSLFYSWLKLLFQKMHEQTDTTYQFLSDLFWQPQQNQLKILFVL